MDLNSWPANGRGGEIILADLAWEVRHNDDNNDDAMMIMIMSIFIHKKDALQTMAKNKQQSPYLKMSVESYKKTNLI